MKTIALDIGDVWTGSAIADSLGISCKPLKTVATKDLYTFLDDLFAKETISRVVVGNPTTMKGTESAQTKKVHAVKKELEEHYPSITWVLWDERLTSKRAASLQYSKKQAGKNKLLEHSIAAAFILQNYLDYRAIEIAPEP